MFCSKCGEKLNEATVFCHKCGVKVNEYISRQEQPVNQEITDTIDEAIPAEKKTSSSKGKRTTTAKVSNASPASPNAAPEIKIRHGFTSFWLWLMLILCISNLIYNIYNIIGGIQSSVTILLIWPIISILALITLMFAWSRSGFSLFIIFSLINGFHSYIEYWDYSRNFIINLFIGFAVSAIIPSITYGVLHLKNPYNAKSTWEQLEKDNVLKKKGKS